MQFLRTNQPLIFAFIFLFFGTYLIFLNILAVDPVLSSIWKIAERILH